MILWRNYFAALYLDNVGYYIGLESISLFGTMSRNYNPNRNTCIKHLIIFGFTLFYILFLILIPNYQMKY